MCLRKWKNVKYSKQLIRELIREHKSWRCEKSLTSHLCVNFLHNFLYKLKKNKRFVRKYGFVYVY